MRYCPCNLKCSHVNTASVIRMYFASSVDCRYDGNCPYWAQNNTIQYIQPKIIQKELVRSDVVSYPVSLSSMGIHKTRANFSVVSVLSHLIQHCTKMMLCLFHKAQCAQRASFILYYVKDLWKAPWKWVRSLCLNTYRILSACDIAQAFIFLVLQWRLYCHVRLHVCM